MPWNEEGWNKRRGLVHLKEFSFSRIRFRFHEWRRESRGLCCWPRGEREMSRVLRETLVTFTSPPLPPSSPSLSTLDLREPLSPPATLSPPPPPPLFSSSPPDAREVDLFHVERGRGGFDSPRECAKKRVNKSDTRPPPLFTRLPSRATGKGRDGEREERVRDRIVLFDCGLFSPLSQGFSFDGGEGSVSRRERFLWKGISVKCFPSNDVLIPRVSRKYSPLEVIN